MEVPEELLSPRSRLAASAARRLAQGISKGVLNLGGILGNFGNILAGEILQTPSLLITFFMTCCPRLHTPIAASMIVVVAICSVCGLQYHVPSCD